MYFFLLENDVTTYLNANPHQEKSVPCSWAKRTYDANFTPPWAVKNGQSKIRVQFPCLNYPWPPHSKLGAVSYKENGTQRSNKAFLVICVTEFFHFLYLLDNNLEYDILPNTALVNGMKFCRKVFLILLVPSQKLEPEGAKIHTIQVTVFLFKYQCHNYSQFLGPPCIFLCVLRIYSWTLLFQYYWFSKDLVFVELDTKHNTFCDIWCFLLTSSHTLKLNTCNQCNCFKLAL